LSQIPIREEDLHGLVDGELEPSQRDALLQYLAEAPSDAVRVEEWRRQIEAIRSAFAQVTAEPLPFSLSLANPRQTIPCKLLPRRKAASDSSLQTGLDGVRQPTKYLWIMLAFVSGLAAALAAIEFTAWYGYSAMSGLRFGLATSGEDRLIERTRSALSTFSRGQNWDAAAVGTLIVPNLSGAGLDFSTARIFSGGDGASLCMIYAIKPDAEAVLCIEEASGVESTGFEVREMHGLRTISWRQAGARYALTTSLSEDILRSIAARAQTEVASFHRR
jgi:anti-sigma factor RsiW